MVLGFGRTGFTMARTLQGLGAKVMVGVRRAGAFCKGVGDGFSAFLYESIYSSKWGNIDLLFNTIPTMIVTAQIIANMPHRALIIDLASKPGGTDFRFAEKRGIKAMLAPGLPGIVAPKTAGRIIANTFSQLIDGRLQRQERMRNELARKTVAMRYPVLTVRLKKSCHRFNGLLMQVPMSFRLYRIQL